MAGTITGVLSRIGVRQGSPQLIKITLTCTADAAAASYPDTVINTLSGVSDFDLRGLKLYSVKAYPGGIAPTDATDLVIEDEHGIDLLGGKGVDFIDATSKTWIPVGPAGYVLPAFITGNITVKISNNAVNSAVTTIVLELNGD
jgi:hypothetical protein